MGLLAIAAYPVIAMVMFAIMSDDRLRSWLWFVVIVLTNTGVFAYLRSITNRLAASKVERKEIKEAIEVVGVAAGTAATAATATDTKIDMAHAEIIATVKEKADVAQVSMESFENLQAKVKTMQEHLDRFIIHEGRGDSMDKLMKDAEAAMDKTEIEKGSGQR